MGPPSKRIVYWVETPAKYELEKTQGRFYANLETVRGRRGYEVDVGVSVAECTFAYRSLMDFDVTSYRRYGPVVTGLNLSKSVDARAFVQGEGVLFNAQIGSLSDLAHSVGRLTPMGQALNFGHIWDG